MRPYNCLVARIGVRIAYIPRRDPRYLRRNALVVLGNSGDGVHRQWRACSAITWGTRTSCCVPTRCGRRPGSGAGTSSTRPRPPWPATHPGLVSRDWSSSTTSHQPMHQVRRASLQDWVLDASHACDKRFPAQGGRDASRTSGSSGSACRRGHGAHRISPGASWWDRQQPFRVVRAGEPVLLPQPHLVRRVRELAESVGAKAVVIDPALPLGLIGPPLGLPYTVVLHGAEVTVPGRLPASQQLLPRVLRGSSLVIAAGGYPEAEARRALPARRSLPAGSSSPPGCGRRAFPASARHRPRPLPEPGSGCRGLDLLS